jgi:hypothetical protein
MSTLGKRFVKLILFKISSLPVHFSSVVKPFPKISQPGLVSDFFGPSVCLVAIPKYWKELCAINWLFIGYFDRFHVQFLQSTSARFLSCVNEGHARSQIATTVYEFTYIRSFCHNALDAHTNYFYLSISDLFLTSQQHNHRQTFTTKLHCIFVHRTRGVVLKDMKAFIYTTRVLFGWSLTKTIEY